MRAQSYFKIHQQTAPLDDTHAHIQTHIYPNRSPPSTTTRGCWATTASPRACASTSSTRHIHIYVYLNIRVHVYMYIHAPLILYPRTRSYSHTYTQKYKPNLLSHTLDIHNTYTHIHIHIHRTPTPSPRGAAWRTCRRSRSTPCRRRVRPFVHIGWGIHSFICLFDEIGWGIDSFEYMCVFVRPFVLVWGNCMFVYDLHVLCIYVYGYIILTHAPPSTASTHQKCQTEYDQRKGTLREWIKQQKAQNPEWQARLCLCHNIYVYVYRSIHVTLIHHSFARTFIYIQLGKSHRRHGRPNKTAAAAATAALTTRPPGPPRPKRRWRTWTWACAASASPVRL